MKFKFPLFIANLINMAVASKYTINIEWAAPTCIRFSFIKENMDIGIPKELADYWKQLDPRCRIKDEVFYIAEDSLHTATIDNTRHTVLPVEDNAA